MKPDQGTETRNVHYPLIYPAIYLLSFSKYKTRGPRYAYEKERKTEGEMWVEVSGFFFIFCGKKWSTQARKEIVPRRLFFTALQ
jgi:hypothetical protein